MSPSITVIVPVYDDDGSLECCLEALLGQTLSRTEYEVVVVDNGARSTLEQLDRYGGIVRVIWEQSPGSYAARNAGVAEAKGQVLAFTDADCIPNSDWLEQGLKALEACDRFAVVGGQVKMFIPEGSARSGPALYDLCLGLRQHRYWEHRGFLITANLFVPSDIFRRVGGFRADVFSGADVEWSVRAAQAGIPLRYAEEAVVGHPVRGSWRALRRKVIRVAGGARDPAYRSALTGGEPNRRAVPEKVSVALGIFRDRRLRNWTERMKVFLVAAMVVWWKLEAVIRRRLRLPDYR